MQLSITSESKFEWLINPWEDEKDAYGRGGKGFAIGNRRGVHCCCVRGEADPVLQRKDSVEESHQHKKKEKDRDGDSQSYIPREL